MGFLPPCSKNQNVRLQHVALISCSTSAQANYTNERFVSGLYYFLVRGILQYFLVPTHFPDSLAGPWPPSASSPVYGSPSSAPFLTHALPAWLLQPWGCPCPPRQRQAPPASGPVTAHRSIWVLVDTASTPRTSLHREVGAGKHCPQGIRFFTGMQR